MSQWLVNWLGCGMITNHPIRAQRATSNRLAISLFCIPSVVSQNNPAARGDAHRGDASTREVLRLRPTTGFNGIAHAVHIRSPHLMRGAAADFSRFTLQNARPFDPYWLSGRFQKSPRRGCSGTDAAEVWPDRWPRSDCDH